MHVFKADRFEEALLKPSLYFIRNNILDGHMSGAAWKFWVRDVVVKLRIHPNDPMVDLGQTTGYKFPTRWNKLLADYVDVEDFRRLYARRHRLKKYGEAKYTFASKSSHSNGNCLLSMTFSGQDDKPRAVLFSRSTIIFPVGLMDLTLAVYLARLFLQDHGAQTKPLELTWYISQFQLWSWSSMPYFLHRGILPDFIKPEWGYIAERLLWVYENRDNPKYLVDSGYLYFRKSRQRLDVAKAHPPYKPSPRSILAHCGLVV